MDSTEKINSLRKKIDKLDDRMIDLVLQRFSIAKEIGDIKKTNGIEVIDLHRESQIINRFAEKLAGTLEKNDITAIFDPIYSISKRLQKIIKCSKEEAIRLGHSYVGSEHLLLALLKEKEGLTRKIIDIFRCCWVTASNAIYVIMFLK